MEDLKLKFLLACENFIPGPKGKYSIINVFTFINAEQIPLQYQPFTIVSGVTGKNGSYLETIEIVDPDDGTVIVKAENTIEIKSFDGNIFAATVNVIFPKAKKYWIRVSVDRKILSNKDDHIIEIKS